MATCAACGKGIPASEMTSGSMYMVSRMMGFGSGDTSPAANLVRNMGSATRAWKCDTCGEWICNACACRTVTSSGAGNIRHSNCGGMFRAPK